MNEILSGLDSRITSLAITSHMVKKVGRFAFDNVYLRELNNLNIVGKEIRLIDDQAFANLKDLQSLHIRKTKISFISKGCFVNLNKLTHLYIMENDRLVSIHRHAFWNLPYLEDLLIHASELHILDEDSFKNVSRLGNLQLNFGRRVVTKENLFAELKNLHLLIIDGQNVILQGNLFKNLF